MTTIGILLIECFWLLSTCIIGKSRNETPPTALGFYVREWGWRARQKQFFVLANSTIERPGEFNDLRDDRAKIHPLTDNVAALFRMKGKWKGRTNDDGHRFDNSSPVDFTAPERPRFEKWKHEYGADKKKLLSRLYSS